jgi:hypothetical protein
MSLLRKNNEIIFAVSNESCFIVTDLVVEIHVFFPKGSNVVTFNPLVPLKSEIIYETNDVILYGESVRLQ